jgi:hypothetical protein
MPTRHYHYKAHNQSQYIYQPNRCNCYFPVQDDVFQNVFLNHEGCVGLVKVHYCSMDQSCGQNDRDRNDCDWNDRDEDESDRDHVQRGDVLLLLTVYTTRPCRRYKVCGIGNHRLANYLSIWMREIRE